MEGLPQDYVIQTLYTRCKRPVYKKYQRVYNAECCVCHEGHSQGKKRRLFYFVEERYFYCFNCCKSWKEINWLQEVTHQNYSEILKEASRFTCSVDLNVKLLEKEEPKTFNTPPIPTDSIDICNNKECEFYTHERELKLITQAKEYCRKRKIFEAVNRPKSLYVSCEDYVHKNRLIIPFYSESGKIESYQSRSLTGDEYPKYLTKYGEKCLYGENNLNSDIAYIFVFEGPIDAMFVKNAVAIGGSTTTDRQETFLKKCLGYEVVYVYDNDKDNKQMDRKIKQVIKQNKKIFVWPKEMKKYKDINEVCCSLNLSEFPYKFIVENSFSGVEALMKFKIR